MDKIFIEGLKLNMVIGAFHWESQITQPIIIDLVLSVNSYLAAQTDDLQYTVNYKQVVEDIHNHIVPNRYHLIETLAQATCNLLFNHFDLVQSIEITVKKPLALVSYGVNAVGFSMQRTRDNTTMKSLIDSTTQGT